MARVVAGIGQFQSAPGGEAGGKVWPECEAMINDGFNPPPAVRPGESTFVARRQRVSVVSIRPRR